MPNIVLRIPVALLLLCCLPFGCSDDGAGDTGPRCGDGICWTNESPTSCSRDCSFACIPEATRCVGNTLVTCLDDGLHEDTASCEPDEVCAVDQCIAASEIGVPDVTTDTGDVTATEDTDMGGDVEEDLLDPDAPEDLSEDVPHVDDIVDEHVEDLPTDESDTTSD